MPNFVKILENLNVNTLSEKLRENPHLWKEITLRQSYPGSMHQDTECIFIRGPEAFTLDKYMMDTGAYDYPHAFTLYEELKDLIGEVMEATECTQLGRILIVKLLPQGFVDEHRDEGTYAEHYSRFHIGVDCPAGSVLTSEGIDQHIQKGECWWFNHRKTHTAFNNSVEDRVHIIIDLVSPNFEVDDVQT